MNTPTVEAIREQAARWCVHLNEGALSDAERSALQEWLMLDARHEREFRVSVAVMSLASELPDMRLEGESPQVQSASPLPTSFPMLRQRRRFLGMAAAAGLVLAVAAGWLMFTEFNPSQPAQVTGTGEMRTVTFEDGSVAYLNTRSSVQWLGGKQARKVALLSGEALFDVAHDAARPFSVMVDKTEVRALGTRFNVYRKQNGEVLVTVVEGKVEVREDTSQNPAWTRKLAAGEQIAYSSIGLTHDVRQVNAIDTVKWREGVLELTDEPLPAVLDELTRYTDRRILIKDPRLAQLRLGGALSTRDVRAALARIEKLAPIAVTESGNTFTLDHREDAR